MAERGDSTDAGWDGLAAGLERHRALGHVQGGPVRVQREHAQGATTAIERVLALLAKQEHVPLIMLLDGAGRRVYGQPDRMRSAPTTCAKC